jgi:hypothetical protein
MLYLIVTVILAAGLCVVLAQRPKKRRPAGTCERCGKPADEVWCPGCLALMDKSLL